LFFFFLFYKVYLFFVRQIETPFANVENVRGF